MRLNQEINLKSTEQTSHCIICNTRFKAPLKIQLSPHANRNPQSESSESNSQPNDGNEGADLKLVKVLQELCSVFSKYFYVKSSILSATTWDFSLEVFPFCIKCRDIVAELSILHHELESVRRKINKLVARTSITIINSFSLNDKTTENDDDNNRKISRVRESIYKKLNPSLVLTDVKNAQNQEKPIPLNQNLSLNGETHVDQNDSENSQVSTAYKNVIQSSNLSKDKDTCSSQNLNQSSVQENSSPVSVAEDCVNENDDFLLASDIGEEDEEEEDIKITINGDDNEIQPTATKNPSSCEKDSLPRQPSIMERIRSKMAQVTIVENPTPKDDDDNDDDDSLSCSSILTDSEDGRGREKIKIAEVKKIGYRKFAVRDDWTFTKRFFNRTRRYYKCGHCDQPEQTTKLILSHILGWHIKSHHQLQNSNEETLEENPKTKKYVYRGKYPFSHQGEKFQCGLCKNTCTNQLTMIRHIQKTHFPEARHFECPKCFHVYTSRSGLKHHDCTKPARPNYIPTVKCGGGKFLFRGEFPFFKLDDNQGYKCGTPDCLYQCKNRLGTITDHIRRRHSDKMRFVCEKCGKNCFSPDDFQNHSATHSDEKNFQCDECGKRTKTSALLRLHKRIHRDVFPYKCDMEGCSWKFKQKTSLQLHKNRHHPKEEERAAWKFKCTICGENLKSERKLDIHTKEHKVQKSAECPECHKKFWGNVQLNIHLNRHKKVIRFFCKECDKGFLQKWMLTRHNQGKQHQERILEMGSSNSCTDAPKNSHSQSHNDDLTKTSSQVTKKMSRKRKKMQQDVENEESEEEEAISIEEENEEDEDEETTEESELEAE